MSDQPDSAVDEQKALDLDDNQVLTEHEKRQAKVAVDLKRRATSAQTMHAKVYSPYKEYYNGQAFSLSAKNLTGPFDILPRHHNFISLLTACELVIRTLDNGEQKTVKILISGGIIHVKANEVLVFLDV